MVELEPVVLPRKILMVNATRGVVGGVERFIIQMSKILREQNWQIYGLFENTVYKHAEFDNAFDDFEVSNSIDLEDIIEHYLELGIEAVCFHKVTKWQWIKQFQSKFLTCVIVHDHDYYCLRRHKYFPLGRINCKLPFSGIYCPVCAGMVEKKDGAIQLIDVEQKFMTLKYIRACKVSFVLSEFMRNNLIMNHWLAGSVHKLLPAQMTTENTDNIPTRQVPVILYVGQLIRGKGVDLLLRALPWISTPYKCIILGRGNDVDYLTKLVKRLKLDSNVEFRGWTSKVSDVYKEADLLVVPSRWQEPYGLIGLEAFAQKIPVVAYDVGGISEWLKAGVNGLLVRPKDIKHLAQAIAELLSNPTKRKKLGLAGFHHVTSYNTEEAMYNSFIGPIGELLKPVDEYPELKAEDE